MPMLRKLLFLLLSLSLSFSLFPLHAQLHRHLKFMNLSMGLPVVDYVCALQDQGLRVVASEPGAYRLHGEVAGIKGCHVIVLTDAPKTRVTRTSVVFPEAVAWADLERLYFQLKEALTQQYGEPTVSKERFKGVSHRADDRVRMAAVCQGKCRYHSDFVRKDGLVTLSIEGHPEGAFVFLLYVDALNDARAGAAP